jgi:hypothetical protein
LRTDHTPEVVHGPVTKSAVPTGLVAERR